MLLGLFGGGEGGGGEFGGGGVTECCKPEVCFRIIGIGKGRGN